MTNRILHANLGILTAITLGLIAISCPFIAAGDWLHDRSLETVGQVLKMIHYGEFLPKGWRWLWINSQGLALFGLVVSGWFLHHRVKKHGSQGGTAETVARDFAATAEEAGLRVFACAADRYPLDKIQDERWLICIVSTFGKGVPPDNGIAFHDFLQSEDAPKLSRLEYAVLGLGDPKFPKFCAFSRSLDERLSALGGKPMTAAVECGTDHMEVSEAWSKGLIQILKARRQMPRPEPGKRRKPAKATKESPS